VHRLIERAGAEAAPRLTTAQAGSIEQYLAISDRPDRALAAIRALAQGGALSAAAEACAARLESIAAQGPRLERMTFSAGFGRSFGYYDGLLFDVVSRELGEDRPVAGGGRYDSLLKRLGSKAATGAVGCMVRPARAWKGTRR
jgi:ATP phosphoribosyltransferase regulatory subunit